MSTPFTIAQKIYREEEILRQLQDRYDAAIRTNDTRWMNLIDPKITRHSRKLQRLRLAAKSP